MNTPVASPAAIPDGVRTLLLDLDGTLLDLAFDNRFWLETVPRRYARERGVTLEAARAEIAPRFEALRGTLAWYSLDHWSGLLGLDLRALTREEIRGNQWVPGALEFLAQQRARGRRLVLATNAALVTLAIKDAALGLGARFDALYSSEQFGAPKEEPRFWEGLFAAEDCDPARTAFIDDNPAVLAAARAAGLTHLVAVTRPDSTRPPHPMPGYVAVATVAELVER